MNIINNDRMEAQFLDKIYICQSSVNTSNTKQA